MKCFLILATCSVLFASALFGQQASPEPTEDKVGQLATEGWAYLQKGDCHSLSLAENDYSQAVSMEPGNAGLHSGLATILMGEGMAKCKSEQERTAYLERAWSEFRTALNLGSTNVTDRGAFVSVSQLLNKKPEYDGGIAQQPTKEEVSRLIADHPALASLDSLESLEDAQLSAAREKALASAKEAVSQKPTDGYAWYHLGDAYRDLNDYKSAEEAFKRALDAFIATPLDSHLLETLGPNAPQPAATMIPLTGLALADVCDHLHKRREAERYRKGALAVFDIQRQQQAQTQP